MITLTYKATSHIINCSKGVMMERKCCVCQIVKKYEEFSKDKQASDGISYRCKECNRKRYKEYSKKMPEEVRQKKRDERNAWGKKNRVHLNKKMRESYRKNHDKMNQKAKEYREKNKEKIYEYNLKYKKNNWEKVLAQSIVKDHVDRKNITKPTICPFCKSSNYRIEAHHTDYSKPLDITWLCQKCHLALHQRIYEEKCLSKGVERLNETASNKEDAKVCSTEETCRGRVEEPSPPSEKMVSSREVKVTASNNDLWVQNLRSTGI